MTYSIRPDIKESIDNYVEHGWPPGDFLQAVLSNDLMNSMGRADMDNRDGLFEICSYIYNEIPAPCHGSREAVAAWIEKKQKHDQ